VHVSIFVVRAVADTLVRAGAPLADLLGQVPLDPKRLYDSEARIELAEFARLAEVGIALSGKPSFGLCVVEQLSHGSMGLLAHLMSHAQTARTALATATQFADLVIDGLRLPAHDDGDDFIIRCVIPRSTPLCDRVLMEMVMVGMVRLFEVFMGARVAPRRVAFEHAAPAYQGEYERLFGGNVLFGQPESAITFERELADRRYIHEHSELFGVLHAEAERKLAGIKAGGRVVERLRRYLSGLPHSQLPSMSDAACQLAMSERSLRRHLAAEGTSYRELVHLQLERSALQLLRDPRLSIKEIASSLGFVNAAAFTSAFKRWTGATPGEYRRVQGARQG
jgi:AraC-like DNA-binding protein